MTIGNQSEYLIKNNGLQSEYIETGSGFKELYLVQAVDGTVLSFESDPRLLLNEVVEVEGAAKEDGRVEVSRYRRKSRFASPVWIGTDGKQLQQVSVVKPDLAVRDQLISHLSQQFFNGDLAKGELLLLWLTSRVYQRTLDIIIGHVSLTLYGQTEGVVEELSKLMPQLFYLPLDLPTINSKLLSHYEVTQDGEEMITGKLFIAADSHLVLDETKMQDGAVTALGVRNLQALANIMQTYQVKYPIQSGETVTGEITSNLDWNILVLSGRQALTSAAPVEDLMADMSVGKKAPLSSLLATSLYLKAGTSPTSNNQNYSEFQEYLKNVAQTPQNQYKVPEDVSDFIVEDFVQRRKNVQAFNENTLKIVLDVARLKCLSRGETLLQQSDYVWSRNQLLQDGVCSIN